MDTEKLLGHKIDQYTIEQHVARGGMADVYLAKDEDLQRHVAFKVMLDTLASEEQFVRRFRREAQTVARLDHPNIIAPIPNRKGAPALGTRKGILSLLDHSHYLCFLVGGDSAAYNRGDHEG